jgi:hypothetical protein
MAIIEAVLLNFTRDLERPKTRANRPRYELKRGTRGNKRLQSSYRMSRGRLYCQHPYLKS